jgi:hypothetical protein
MAEGEIIICFANIYIYIYIYIYILQFFYKADVSNSEWWDGHTEDVLWWCLLKNTTFHEVALLGTIHVLRKRKRK